MEPSAILAIKLEEGDNATKFTCNQKNKEIIHSWSTYTWICCHCLDVFDNLEELRSHSKEKHNLCNAFSCADCNNTYFTFKDFVEHVRQHRNVLGHYCEYCNMPFSSQKECSEHVIVHNLSTQKICELCGEMLPYPSTLEWHKQLYGPRDDAVGEGKSWEDYDWGCQECGTKFSDVNSLRSHVQSAHGVCFSFRCADCKIKTRTFKNFAKHVAIHRPYLKNYCQYCNAYFPAFQEMNQHIVQHITSQQRPCNICGQIFYDNIQLARHKKMFADSSPKKSVSEPKSAPRVRKKCSELTVDDLTCKLCAKVFDSAGKLKRHEETHSFRRRDFVCMHCGRAFFTKAALQDHIKTHKEKTEVCKVCNKKFHTKWKLKSHLVTHSTIRPFTCDECGADFKTKRRLTSHQKKHSDVKPFKCSYCPKEFRFKENLKTHEYQHTGIRPYACEFCERTFTNWTNCNKHMLRKHGVTLAKTKITEHGRLTINRTSGEVQKLNSDSNTEQWLKDMLAPKRSRRSSDSEDDSS